MADFCKQCSIEVWGHDSKDFVREDSLPNYYPVICELCGYTIVDKNGICIASDCLKKHGGEQKCQVSNTCT